MIDKIKAQAIHYWTDHKEMIIVILVILAIAIIQ